MMWGRVKIRKMQYQELYWYKKKSGKLNSGNLEFKKRHIRNFFFSKIFLGKTIFQESFISGA